MAFSVLFTSIMESGWHERYAMMNPGSRSLMVDGWFFTFLYELIICCTSQHVLFLSFSLFPYFPGLVFMNSPGTLSGLAP